MYICLCNGYLQQAGRALCPPLAPTANGRESCALLSKDACAALPHIIIAAKAPVNRAAEVHTLCWVLIVASCN